MKIKLAKPRYNELRKSWEIVLFEYRLAEWRVYWDAPYFNTEVEALDYIEKHTALRLQLSFDFNKEGGNK